MDTVGAFEAKTHLSELLDRVSQGETITIIRHGVPAARLVPAGETTKKLTHREVTEGMRALRQRIRPGRMTVREMVGQALLTGIVVDASVALAWCFPGEASEYADAVLATLEGRSALVPAVWPLEVANAMAVAERRGRIRQPDVRRFVELLEALAIHEDLLPVARSVSNILPLAREYGLSAYDAAYLELATRHAAPLARLDRGLEKAARQAGVQILPRPPKSRT
jgi:prevent-host-death family protein